MLTHSSSPRQTGSHLLRLTDLRSLMPIDSNLLMLTDYYLLKLTLDLA